VAYNESGLALSILDEMIELEAASEASDIIWENMSLCEHKIIKRTIIVWAAVLVFLILIVFLFMQA
jgi:uncharacterized membrane protein YvbJ